MNRLPRPWAERVYAASGVAEAVPARRGAEISSDQIARWMVEHYPKRRYPVIFVGASNGVLIHLAAALGAPWLPQRLLIPVRRKDVDRDDPRVELRAGLGPGRALLAANPDLVLHHVHDPNQDRLMIAGMSYFRVKWRRLPAAYRDFIRDHLAPGGVVVGVDCGLSWPVERVGHRHLLQFGALGGATEEEYRNGGPRVADFLRERGSARRCWDPPACDERAPEAEWGFDEALLDGLDQVARRNRAGMRRLSFSEPGDLSPVVAEIHRRWFAGRGIPTDRLLAECFLLMEPWWALRSGSIPFWMPFNIEQSLRELEDYLDAAGCPDEIQVLLFSHGVESIGLARIDQWQRVAGRAGKVGTLVGVDANAYPRDFASLVRAHRELSRIRHRHPMPRPLSPEEAEPVLRGSSAVRWHSD